MTRWSRDAIDKALDRLYPTERDFRVGFTAAADEDAPPIIEAAAYRALEPAPHWHYISYGLSEWFGVEYTIRLVDPVLEPPTWPFQLLRVLATQTVKTRCPYLHGHSMNLPYAMLEKYSAGVEGFAFYNDEDLGTIDTPAGAVAFVQAVPLQRGEYDLMGMWNAFGVEAELVAAEGDRLWRPGRVSLLDGARGDAIRAAVEREGSSQDADYAELSPAAGEFALDSVGVRVFLKFLRHRIAHERGARVITPDGEIRIEPGAWAYEHAGGHTTVRVPAREARSLADEIERASDGSRVTRPGGLSLIVDRTL